MRAVLYAKLPTGVIEYPLVPGQSVSVGRSSEVTFTVPHDTVSSRHFSIVWNSPYFELTNHSRFGTFVGRQKFEGQVRLGDGQTFIAGEISFHVEELPPEDATLAPSRSMQDALRAAEPTIPVPAVKPANQAKASKQPKATKADGASSGPSRLLIGALAAFVAVIVAVCIAAVMGRGDKDNQIRRPKETDFTDDAWAKVDGFCSASQECVSKAKAAIRQAKDLHDKRGLSDRNLFDAVQLSSKALSLVKKADQDVPAGLFGEAADLRKRLGKAMNDEVNTLVFDFRRSLRTKNFDRSQRLVERLRKMFPDRESVGYRWARNMGRAMDKCRRQGGKACQR